jgi:hypothetical protein
LVVIIYLVTPLERSGSEKELIPEQIQKIHQQHLLLIQQRLSEDEATAFEIQVPDHQFAS